VTESLLIASSSVIWEQTDIARLILDTPIGNSSYFQLKDISSPLSTNELSNSAPMNGKVGANCLEHDLGRENP
jgi:hypothetical protein